VQPLVNLGLALKALDVSNLGPCIMGFDLPIAFGNPLHFENDTLLSHDVEYEPFGVSRKHKNRPAVFKFATSYEWHPLTKGSIDGGDGRSNTWTCRRQDEVLR
jgi:hypothetical protein